MIATDLLPQGKYTSGLNRRRFLLLGCACCALGVVPSFAAEGVPPEAVQRHLDLAREAAGDDLEPYLRLGDTAMVPPAAPKLDLVRLINQPVPEPGRAFDNLYFVGAKWVSAWVVQTSDGLILIDALNNDAEAEEVIVGGMRKLGLDPTQIRIVVITHGHGDHYGGINYIKRLASPNVLASDADWAMMETRLEFDAPEWGRPPERDGTVRDGEQITLGDTSIEVLETPGHTMGTLSLLLPVRDGARSHRVLLWGGTSFNFGAQPDRMKRIEVYIASTERVRDIVRQSDVDVLLSNHSSVDRTIERLAERLSANRNPFVIGTPTVVRALTVMNETAKATREAWRT